MLGACFFGTLGCDGALDASTRAVVAETTIVRAPVEPLARDVLDPRVARLLDGEIERVREDPDDASRHGMLGLAYEANGLAEEARRAFALACAIDPDEPLWTLHLALAVRSLEGVTVALPLFEDAAMRLPESAAVQFRFGESLLECGRIASAVEAFERACALAPESSAGAAGLGAALLDAGEDERAAEVLERAVALEPSYRHAHYLLGMAYRALGRADEARVELVLGVDGRAQAIADELEADKRRFVTTLASRIERAARLVEMGEGGRALRILERESAREPDNVLLLNNLAVAYMADGRFDDALSVLERATELEPGRPLSRINAATCLQSMGLVRRSLEEVDRAIEVAPSYALGHATRAELLLGAGQADEALASARTARDLAPWDAEVLELLARAAHAAGRDDEGVVVRGALAQIAPQEARERASADAGE